MRPTKSAPAAIALIMSVPPQNEPSIVTFARPVTTSTIWGTPPLNLGRDQGVAAMLETYIQSTPWSIAMPASSTVAIPFSTSGNLYVSWTSFTVRQSSNLAGPLGEPSHQIAIGNISFAPAEDRRIHIQAECSKPQATTRAT